MTRRREALAGAAVRGLFAGLAGVAAMTAAEKVEQAMTRRPNSYVPGRTLSTMAGTPQGDYHRSMAWNHAMHWGTGALLGALRGVWSATGIRGPRANGTYTIVRLAFDQTMENAAGTGSPPADWPAFEQALDAIHKAIYSLVTGIVADRIVPDTLRSPRGTSSH